MTQSSVLTEVVFLKSGHGQVISIIITVLWILYNLRYTFLKYMKCMLCILSLQNLIEDSARKNYICYTQIIMLSIIDTTLFSYELSYTIHSLKIKVLSFCVTIRVFKSLCISAMTFSCNVVMTVFLYRICYTIVYRQCKQYH